MAPASTRCAPANSTTDVATPTRTSVLRSRPAERRLALTPSLSDFLLLDVNVSCMTPSREYDLTTRIEESASVACEPSDPSASRCSRETELIRRPSRRLVQKNAGKTI